MTPSEQTHNPELPFEWNDIYTGKAADLEPPDELLVEVISGLKPGKALDVGCGAGGLLLALAERGFEISGIDLAERAIESARAVLSERGFEAELEAADATKWTPKQQFDLVTNSFALPITVEERSAVFRMIQNATKPGGRFVLKEFDPSMAKPGSPLANMNLVSVDELKEAFADWEIERAEVLETAAHHHGDAPEGVEDPGDPWTAVIFVARRPARGEDA